MSDTLNSIATRYSCRSFTDQTPTDEMLEAIVTAGLQAPSGMNKQPWRLIAVTNKEVIADMEAEGMRILKEMPDQSAYERIMGRGGKVLYNTSALVVVVIDGGPGSELDCGIVMENMALAATAQGLGNVICGLAGLVFAGPKGGEFAARLGIPDGYRFGCSLLIGHAAASGTPHEPDREKVSWVR